NVAKAKAVSLAQGNLDGGRLAKTLKFENGELVHLVPLPPKEMQAGVDGRMTRNRLALLRGRVSVPGFAGVKLLEVMELRGIGKRFNGKTAITGLRHRVDSQGWRTDVQFGISPIPFSRQPDIQESAASGFLPGTRGLQIGMVTEFKEDPDKNLRARVTLPALGDKAGAVWARLASPDAGKERGFFFRPEIGDEVVVGFLNEDPRQPIILGAMFSSKNAAPKDFGPVSDKNLKKGIFTKGGTKLQFLDDKKASLLIETAGKNKIVLDDDKQSVEIADQHGNAVTLDKSGIKLKSAKDLIIESSGKVQIKASGKVDIQGAKVDVK
ncbi:MAG TPA: phage baseplate assembly protein V, partial [Verrucomicrobiota bacterium]|nr:phage baseplate assembly protein V [Verrucomicrobiota bacterium]